MRRLSITTWSLHHSLGAPPMSDVPAHTHRITSVERPVVLTLLELPDRLRESGIGTFEICHFHLPATDRGYLDELRSAIRGAGVELFSILIDTGNIAAADAGERETALRVIESWIDVAAELGAGHARAIAGDAPVDDEAALRRSIDGLRRLGTYAGQRRVRLLTENFKSLASTSANCHRILDALDGAVGLCADMGNFPAEVRVAEFKAIVGRATSVHAKATYDSGGAIAGEDLNACLAASVDAGFDGPYTLVYDRRGDEWAGIRRLAEVVGPRIA